MGRRPLRLADALAVQHRPPSLPKPLVAIPLTKEAYTHLKDRAVTLGYVRHDALKPIGFLAYIVHSLCAPTLTYTDTRPQYLIDLSARLLDPSHDVDRRRNAEGSITSLWLPNLPSFKSHRPGPTHPIWWDPDLDTPRSRHTFIKADFPFTSLTAIGLLHQVGDPYHRTFQTTPTILSANVLEAIGRKHLTPAFEIPNANPPKSPQRRPRPVEIRW